MEFEGKLAVCPLQLGRISLAGYAEHFVVVSFFTHGDDLLAYLKTASPP
jgi:hypothetical protein